MLRISPMFFVLVSAMAFNVPVASEAQAARLVIDHVDATTFAADKKIRIFFDLRDAKGKPVEGLSAPDIKALKIDGKTVPGAMSLQTFADAKEPVALGVLIAAHRSYVDSGSVESEGAGSEADPRASTPFEQCKRGVAKMLESLGPQDRVRVFTYFEKGHREVVPWTGDVSAAANALKGLKAKASAFGPGTYSSPPFSRVLLGVLGKLSHRDPSVPDSPRRKVLLTCTDGEDGTGSRVVNAEEKKASAEAIETILADTGVRLHVLGYTEGDPVWLVALHGLVQATKGAFREVEPPDDIDVLPEIAAAMEQFGKAIGKQYVLTVTPDTKVFRGTATPSTLRLEVEMSGEPSAGNIAKVVVPVLPAEKSGCASGPSSGSTMFLWAALLLLVATRRRAAVAPPAGSGVP